MPAGIFVDDIIEAGAIDKYFELFKPNGGGEGGERAEEGGERGEGQASNVRGGRIGCVWSGRLTCILRLCGGGGEGGSGLGGRGGAVRVNHDTDGGREKAGSAGSVEPADRCGTGCQVMHVVRASPRPL